MPGLVIDKYADVLVVECLALGMEQFKETIVSLLKGVLKEDGISIRGVYERSDANERRKEGLPKVKGFIGETFDTEVEITENGVHYLVDVVNGQKTGFSWTRSITGWQCSGSVKEREFWTVLHIWERLH